MRQNWGIWVPSVEQSLKFLQVGNNIGTSTSCVKQTEIGIGKTVEEVIKP